MINVTNIFIKYGDRVLLDHVNFVIGTKDKIGLVGRNGAGKSTLMKLISGYMNPHSGNISYPGEVSIGYLHQEMELPKGKTVMEETLSAFNKVKELENRIEQINVELGERTDYESAAYTNLLNELSDLNDRILHMGGNNIEADCERVLKGLGFKQTDFTRLTDEFSGGWQMRIELSKMLLQKPDYLLLDEPTNHLDIESIIWLEGFLKDYSKAVVVISHDKQFLDNVTNRTVEVELGKIYDYKASYTKFVQLRQERRELQGSAYENQQRVIAHKEKIINKFMAKATKTKMAQSMKKQLDKMERIEIDTEDVATMNLRFPPAPRSGQVVLDAQNIVKKYGHLDVLSGVDLKIDRGDRVSFVGQNGQGKTTLAKILINELPATDGDITLGHNVSIGYYAQNQSDTLQSDLTLLQTMENFSPPEMRTSLRKILGAFMFSGEDAEKKVSVLSGGERARLAMACLLLRPFNLLVLDEPTNHLDMLTKDVLKHALSQYDGTLIVVSHDRDFLADLTNRTIEFRDQKLYEHIGDVNAFLEKKAMDDMRQVEMRTVAKKEVEHPQHNGSSNGIRQVDHKERKRIQRNAKNAEKKVERLEEDIQQMDLEMSNPDFYGKPDADEKIKKYQALQKDLETAMENWELATEELEAIGEG